MKAVTWITSVGSLDLFHQQILIERPLCARLGLRCWDTVTNKRNSFCPLGDGFSPASSSSSSKTQREWPFLHPAFPRILTTPCIFCFCENLPGTCLVTFNWVAQNLVHSFSVNNASQSSSYLEMPELFADITGSLQSGLAPCKPRSPSLASPPTDKDTKRNSLPNPTPSAPLFAPHPVPQDAFPNWLPDPANIHRHLSALTWPSCLLCWPGLPPPFLLLLYASHQPASVPLTHQAHSYPRDFTLALPNIWNALSLALLHAELKWPLLRGPPRSRNQKPLFIPSFCLFSFSTTDSHFRVYLYVHLFPICIQISSVRDVSTTRDFGLAFSVSPGPSTVPST